MRLRIAHVTATFPPYRGGTGNVCFHNARELARRGHDVHVFTAAYADVPGHEERDGIQIHRLRPLVRVGNAPLLPGLLWKLRGFDVIHLHYPFFGGELSALAARLNRTPLVVTYHQDVLLGGLLGIVEKGLRATVGRAALRSATKMLFTSSDYGKTSYILPLLRGRERHIGALANGVDTNLFTPGPVSADLRQHYRLTDEDQVVLLVAGLDSAHYFKGVPIFLSAFAKLPPTIKGMIIGDGDLRMSYQRQAEQLGIRDRIIFAGRVTNDDLPAHYGLADITVLPSTTMGEAFGLVLLESMACGTPVIASNLPGVRTVVAHGYDGLLVEAENHIQLAEAVRELLSDDARRSTMGERGREKATSHYDWRLLGGTLEQIYREVSPTSLKVYEA